MRTIAGRYRLEEPVGRGGFAVVHRAYDRTLRRQVAVKLLDSAQTSDTLSEARAAAKLNHPHVARVYDYGETTAGGRTTAFLVMEYVDGETLADRLIRDGPLPWAEAATVCAQVASALAAAHALQLVHRDIKPCNILLAPAGVKVVDFGVAAMAGQRSTDEHGQVWGTPLYLAPEQLRGERCFPPADVFALGLLLHACLTGRPPWSGTGAEEVFTARRLRPVPTLPGPHELPPALVAVHDSWLQPVARRRPGAAEVAAVLRRYVNGLGSAAAGAVPAVPFRGVLVGIAAAVVLIAGALALPSTPGETSEAAAQAALTPSHRSLAPGVNSAPTLSVETTQVLRSAAPLPARSGPMRPSSRHTQSTAAATVVAATSPRTQQPSTTPSETPPSVCRRPPLRRAPHRPRPAAAPSPRRRRRRIVPHPRHRSDRHQRPRPPHPARR